tara:strand:- start:82802 stop:83167 length:366 start_codon:yes stop_codon:yes gene_type:complete
MKNSLNKVDTSNQERIIDNLTKIRKYLIGTKGIMHIYSLCHCAMVVDNNNGFIRMWIKSYLISLYPNKKIYYNHCGKECERLYKLPRGRSEMLLFYWKPNDYKSRLDFLNKRIKIEREKLI